MVDSSIDPAKMKKLPAEMFTERQLADVGALSGRKFSHTWELVNVLSGMNPEWKMLEENILNKQKNSKKKRRIQILEKVFKTEQ